MADQLTAVLFALHREAEPFRRLAGCVRVVPAPIPAWADRGTTLVLVTGMGAKASARAVAWLLAAHRPARVISAGFCGSLVATLRVGDLIQPKEIRQVNNLPGGGRTADIVLVSVEKAVENRAARERLRQQTGADAVDMESAVIASRCKEAGLPFHSLRVVTDDLDTPLPPELTAVIDGERLRPLALLAALLQRPRLATDLLRLARHSRDGARRLASAVVTLLDAGGEGDSGA